MVKVPFFQVDAFAEAALKGNAAAVMLMSEFPAPELMQAIAAENNVAETAFVVRRSEGVWDLRWFTPTVEVPLCGHATLASAHILFEHEKYAGDAIGFDTASGRLNVVRREDGRLAMNFPAQRPVQIEIPPGLAEAIGEAPSEVWRGPYLMAVFDSAEIVRGLKPNLTEIESICGGIVGGRGNLICTAPGDGGFDVVSRFFAPGSGIDEDPATGSAHCILAPYWVDRLNTSQLDCFQAYPGRGGVIGVRVEGDRVLLIGRARTVIEGVFELPNRL